MTFISPKFFIFLPIVYFVFYFTPDRWRWLVLLVASYGFYAAFKAPYLLAVLLMVTIISFACGLHISRQQDELSRKRWLQAGIVACLAILALLKYFPFLESQANSIFSLNNTLSETIISIGCSYFIFQAISYLADIYLEIEEPETHFGHYALYIAFFPKLLQGPIERAGNLIPQLKQSYVFDYDAMRSGMLLFTWGLFKKVVVADRFAIYADQVFNNVHSYTGLPLILGAYAYAFQIYYDFSAYTDMARGIGRIFGINLTENFNQPYIATSIADFWRRWHISFSRWILDYIFKPLQMGWRNSGTVGTALALLVTFLVSGIWHGATWGFVLWGLLHGIYLATSTFYKPHQRRLYKWLRIKEGKLLRVWQVIATFNLITFAWIFFRANTLSEIRYIISNIFVFTDIVMIFEPSSYSNLVFLFVAILYGFFVNKYIKFDLLLYSKLRWVYYYLHSVIICYLGLSNGKFIYFQF